MNTCLRAGWAALPAALRWRFSQHHCPCQCEEAARRAARQRWFDKHRRGDPGCPLVKVCAALPGAGHGAGPGEAPAWLQRRQSADACSSTHFSLRAGARHGIPCAGLGDRRLRGLRPEVWMYGHIFWCFHRCRGRFYRSCQLQAAFSFEDYVAAVRTSVLCTNPV